MVSKPKKYYLTKEELRLLLLETILRTNIDLLEKTDEKWINDLIDKLIKEKYGKNNNSK